MRFWFGDCIAAYVIQPGTAVSGGRLAVLRGGAAVWFYDADTGGTRIDDLTDAVGNPITEVITTNASTDLGYMPKFSGEENINYMWADANGGAGPRFLIESTDEKVYTGGVQTITGAKSVSGQISNTNTYTWIMPINVTHTAQIGAITIRNDNSVDPTDSPDLITVWYKGNTDSKRRFVVNEWGGVRVWVPPLADLGYADVAMKLFESVNGGEDGLQVFGPGGTKKFYVRDGAVWADSLTLTGNATATTAPTLGGHLTNKTYVDALVVGGAPDATTTSKGILKLAGDLAGTALLPTVPGLAAKAADSAVVHNTGAETLAGVKTFSSSPIVPTPTTATQAATKAYADSVGGASDATTSSKGIVQLAGDLAGTAASPTVPALAAKAADSAVVHNTGAETLAGVKTFSSLPTIPVTPIASTDAASKGYVDGLALFVRKTADTTRSSTATLANDPHLVIAMIANATYEATLFATFNTSIAGGFRNAFALPSGAVSRMFVTSTSLGYIVDNAAVDTWTVSATNTYAIGYRGLVITAGTAGNFAFQWAQKTSDAGATNVLTNSYLILRRVA